MIGVMWVMMCFSTVNVIIVLFMSDLLSRDLPMSSPGLDRPPGNFHAFIVCIGGKELINEVRSQCCTL